MNWINTLNTTSFRIIASVGLIYMTGARYMASGIGQQGGGLHFDKWEPSPSWLVFLAVLSGVEGAILIAKRLTDYKYKEIAATATQPNVTVEQANVQAGDVTVESQTKG